MAVATAAPAFAQNSGEVQGEFASNAFRGDGSDDQWDSTNGNHSTTVVTTVELRANYIAGGPVATSAELLITVPSAAFTSAAPNPVAGTGWSYSGLSEGGSSRTYTFVYGGEISSTNTTTLPALTFKLAFATRPPGTVTVTGSVSATGFKTLSTLSYTKTF